MQFSRNKFTKVLLILAGILILLLAGILVYRAKFSADSVDQNDTSFLDNMEDKPNLNDPTIIRLPSSYSKEDIQKALNNSTVTGIKGLTSVNDKEIANYISSQAEKTAKSLPLNSGTKDKPAMNDIVFRIANSSGEIISPISFKKNTIKSVDDNFNFDSSVPQIERDIMLKVYPLIEAVYGPRQNTDRINVFHDASLDRGYYLSFGNQIHLDNAFRNDEPIHELVHAFHGYRCLNSLWEEGSAVLISTKVQKQMQLPGDEYSIVQMGYYNFGFENLPSVFDRDLWNNAWNPWSENLPYIYGSMIQEKIFMEDSDFFRKFNQKIYAGNASPSRGAVLKAAIQSVATIEGESSASWFSHQYPYIDNINRVGSETYFNTIANTFQKGYECNTGGGIGAPAKGGSGGSECGFGFDIRADYNIDNSDFDVRFLDEKNKFW